MRKAYEDYDFQSIFHAINEFVTVDLSAVYLDVSKDRLYTFGAASRERRSAQTAVYVIADGLARLMAPVLSITADEIWARLPGTREASVHLAEFPADAGTWRDEALDADWGQLLELRDQVNAALEGARQRKEIGNAPVGARDDFDQRRVARSARQVRDPNCRCGSSPRASPSSVADRRLRRSVSGMPMAKNVRAAGGS